MPISIEEKAQNSFVIQFANRIVAMRFLPQIDSMKVVINSRTLTFEPAQSFESIWGQILESLPKSARYPFPQWIFPEASAQGWEIGLAVALGAAVLYTKNLLNRTTYGMYWELCKSVQIGSYDRENRQYSAAVNAARFDQSWHTAGSRCTDEIQGMRDCLNQLGKEIKRPIPDDLKGYFHQTVESKASQSGSSN